MSAGKNGSWKLPIPFSLKCTKMLFSNITLDDYIPHYVPRGPSRHASAYKIFKSTGFHVDFRFQNGFLDFKVDFWISSGFLDFKADFWISFEPLLF